eukprot:3774560-Rhodomonas_salina.3
MAELNVMADNSRDTAGEKERRAKACIPCKLGRRKCNHSRPCGQCCRRNLEAECLDEVKEVSFGRSSGTSAKHPDRTLNVTVFRRSTPHALCARSERSNATGNDHMAASSHDEYSLGNQKAPPEGVCEQVEDAMNTAQKRGALWKRF